MSAANGTAPDTAKRRAGEEKQGLVGEGGEEDKYDVVDLMRPMDVESAHVDDADASAPPTTVDGGERPLPGGELRPPLSEAPLEMGTPPTTGPQAKRGCRFDWRVNLIRFAFLATGVWWGVGLQLMVYAGVAAREMSQLPTLDWYGGMLLSLLPGRFLSLACTRGDPSCTLRVGKLTAASVPPWRPLVSNFDVILASWCDVFGTITTAMGMTMSGSAIFGIVFSSVSSWAALLRWGILGERLRPVQLAGVMLVTLGLVLSGYDEDTASAEGKRVVLGIVLTLAGTVSYGLEYVLCERAMVTDSTLTPVDFLWYMGLWGVFLMAIYICAYTVPRWEELVARPTREGGASAWYLAFLFVSHTLNNWLHNITWFMICEKEGSVSTGLLQGLKAIMLFAASSLAFCHIQPSQCYSTAKGAATCVVVVGTLVYYSVPSVAAKRPETSRAASGDMKAQWKELTAVSTTAEA